MERKRDKWGRFAPSTRNYVNLLKSNAVRIFAETLAPSTRHRDLHTLKWFLEFNNVGVEEFLELPEKEIKRMIKRAILVKRREGKTAQARTIFYCVTRFLEVNGREVHFNRTEKKALLKQIPKKVAIEYIPTREDIYRMVDSFPRKNERQWLRGRAMILCLWQSGVRVSCLVSWTWGMFKDKLYPEPKIPVPIKVVAKRPEGVWDVAEDSKLSAYNVGYYYTFLHKEAAYALKEYLDARIRDGWKPKDSDPIWVTEGFGEHNVGKPIKEWSVREVVKDAAKQIGIDPKTIWTHCFRKAFRKTLYQSGVDLDIAEAMMGHKLPASRGNYFDYHDLNFLKEEYMKGFWERVEVNTVKKLESELAELRQKTVEVEKLRKQVERMEKFLRKVLPRGLESEEDLEWFQKMVQKRVEDRVLTETKELQKRDEEEKRRIISELRNKTNNNSKYKIVKGEDELLRKLDEGWELVKELNGDRYLLKKS